MTTFAALRTLVARDLRDPDKLVFDDPTLGDLVNAAIVEVGRIAPERFQDDITPVANTMNYTVHTATPSAEVEVMRVELWDGSQTPERFVSWFTPASQSPANTSAAGWETWGGTLRLTYDQVFTIDPTKHIIKVWGYAPYATLVNDADVIAVGAELEQAIRTYCRIEALRRLVMERDLYTQWQTRANNTDVSPAALMNGLAQAEEMWRRLERKLAVLRGAP